MVGNINMNNFSIFNAQWINATFTNISINFTNIFNPIWVNRTGDTMTGDLTLTGASLLVSDKLGIGTTNPSQKLEVIGNAKIIGDLNVTGTINTSSFLCTDCINQLEIEDIYVLTAGDTMTGNLVINANLTVNGTLILPNILQLSPSQSTFVVRDDSSGIIGTKFGVRNIIASNDSSSGVSYVLDIGSSNSMNLDLHSRLDPNNPLQVVSHYNNDVRGHVWRLNANNENASFIWEVGINNPVMKINVTGEITFNNSMTITKDGKIGIGTNIPVTLLNIEGATTTGNFLLLLNETTSNGAGEFATFIDRDGDEIFGFDKNSNGGGVFDIRSATGISVVRINVNGVSYFGGGNIGIGTATPSQELEVVGYINVTGTGTSNSTFNGDVRILGTLFGSSPLRISGGLNVTSGLVVFPFSNFSVNNNTLFVDSDTKRVGIRTSTPDESFVVNGTSFFNGNVGIGERSPNYKLTVVGGVNITQGINITGIIQFLDLINCDTLDTNENGTLVCGTDATGGAGAVNGTDINVKKVIVSTLLNCDTINTTGTGELVCGTDGGGTATDVYVNETGDTMSGVFTLTGNLTQDGSTKIYFEGDDVIICLGC